MKLLIIKEKIKFFAQLFLRPQGKFSFLNNLPKNPKILDVGCGNNSAYKIKLCLPNSYYVGVDIGDYNNENDVNLYADKFILTNPSNFVESILSINIKFDAVISSHNLEHCNDRYGTLNAILDKLKDGGKIYLSFPSEKTINFPKRDGCLNYYDDPTHKDSPPNFDRVLEIMREKSLNILFSTRSYKPLLLNRFGYFANLVSNYTKKTSIGLWEWWGFESIIIAQKSII